MPLYFIHAVNSEYECRDDGADYGSPELALFAGVQSAVGMVTDEIQGGSPNAAVQVSIESADGSLVRRSVVSLSVSPMFAGQPMSGQVDGPSS